jgi:hypothetical protein
MNIIKYDGVQLNPRTKENKFKYPGTKCFFCDEITLAYLRFIITDEEIPIYICRPCLLNWEKDISTCITKEIQTVTLNYFIIHCRKCGQVDYTEQLAEAPICSNKNCKSGNLYIERANKISWAAIEPTGPEKEE